jgi:hypothetical protein
MMDFPQAELPSPEPAADEKKDYKPLLTKVEDRFKHIQDKWGKDGDKVWSIYLGDEVGISFNILYSNTETIVPAVFSRKPIPRVTRRHDDARADVPAKIANRYLSFAMDMNLPSYPSYMTALEDAVLDAALPGQGLCRVRLVDGLSMLDLVEWNKFAWGYSTRWERCPWVAFAHDMEPADILEQFPELTEAQKRHFETKAKETEADQELATNGEKKPTTIRVWETWVRKTKERHWLCDAAMDCCLASEPDPLKLDGFFPVPKPLRFIHSTTDTMPRPLYKIYQEQAEELNELTRRLRNVVKAIRVRGIYASGIDDITRVFQEDDDNVFIPSTAASQIVTTGKGLEAYIWMLPIQELSTVAQQLFQARESIKGVIYETLGIGDILRGVTKASETLGAQQLKDKWGSLRINKIRELTAEFVRDGLRLILDCAVKNTPSNKWQEITGIKLQPEPETAVMVNAGQQAAIDPMNTWAGVLAALKDNLQRAYLIDIEVNSSVDAEATEQKAEMAEFMNALGQSMAGLKDLMGSSPQGWELGKTILSGICAKFELGADVEPQIRNLPAPQQQDPKQLQKMMQDVQKGMQEIAKEKEALKSEEEALKDMLQQVKDIQKLVEQQKESLDRDKKDALREIEFAAREEQMSIAEQRLGLQEQISKLTMAGQKVQMAHEKGVHKNQMAAAKVGMAAEQGANRIKAAAQSKPGAK